MRLLRTVPTRPLSFEPRRALPCAPTRERAKPATTPPHARGSFAYEIAREPLPNASADGGARGLLIAVLLALFLVCLIALLLGTVLLLALAMPTRFASRLAALALLAA